MYSFPNTQGRFAVAKLQHDRLQIGVLEPLVDQLLRTRSADPARASGETVFLDASFAYNFSYGQLTKTDLTANASGRTVLYRNRTYTAKSRC